MIPAQSTHRIEDLNFERPEFQRMLPDIEAGKISTVDTVEFRGRGAHDGEKLVNYQNS